MVCLPAICLFVNEVCAEDILGQVRDAAGAPIAGAQIQALDPDGKVVSTTVSSHQVDCREL